MGTSDLNVTVGQVAGHSENNEPVATKGYAGYISDDLYASQIARGNVIGASTAGSYGKLTVSSGVTNHVIHPVGIGANLNVPDEAGVQMTIVSTNSEDDKDGGDGIRSIEIHYLDGDLNPQSEIIELEGSTIVLTNATDIRFIQCMHGVTYGDTKSAEGDISAKNATIAYSLIPEGDRRCASSVRRIPAGKRLVIKSIFGGSASGTAAAVATIALFSTVIEDVDDTEEGIFYPHMEISLQDGSEALPLDMPIMFPSGSIVGFSVTTDKGAIVNGGFIGYFENI